MDSYGLLGLGQGPERIQHLNKRIEKLVEKGASTPHQKAELAKLMSLRDSFIAKAAAKQGAASALGSGYPGVAGGIASSGIRGVDVIEHEFTPEMVAQYNVDGANQGSRAFSQAPPGSGRLNSIPFVVSGSTVPAQVHTAPGTFGLGTLTQLQTAQINWAILKIVAFTTQASASASGTFGVVTNLTVGGGANLFLNANVVLMDDYDIDRDAYNGLRAYPYLVSPNQAYVQAGAVGASAATVTAACSLVIDVIRDDSFGPGIPGPYAR